MARRTRGPLGVDVYQAAIDRLKEQYSAGHRLVVSFSGGKDSMACVELAIIAARETDRLPVEVVFRDEEVIMPGTVEYVERTAERPEVSMTWLVANMPQVNAFNREEPYWWTFDPLLDKTEWVRTPPDWNTHSDDLSITAMTTQARFPTDVENGQKLISVVGLRVEESRGRLYGLFSSGGYMTGADKRTGVYGVRPIYDWRDGDIWRAVRDGGWDYSTAYDVMFRHGFRPAAMRIGPPSMEHGIRSLQLAAKAWPDWWDRVCTRLPGVRSAAHYGKRVIEPDRRYGESWEQTFQRECIDEAPEWIAVRADRVRTVMLSAHRHHSTTPFPEVESCHPCHGNMGSWKAMAKVMYLGDPFSMRATMLPYVEPEFFRAGAGRWGGHPG